MKFTKKFISNLEQLTGSKILDIVIFDSIEDSFLVIETDQGFLVLDELFDEVNETTFSNEKGLDNNELFKFGMIDSDTFKSLEFIDDLELNSMSYNDLEILYHTIAKLLND